MNDHQHKKPLKEILKNLKPDTQPQWGKMTPQHMVEHLSDSINISNGRRKLSPAFPEDETARAKALLMTERPLPRGVVNTPNGELLPLRHSTIELAIQELQDAVDEYNEHYLINKDANYAHPRFGHLNQVEWDRFHDKHFTHHFKQFGLTE